MVEEARDCQAGEGALVHRPWSCPSRVKGQTGPPGESGDFSCRETFRLCREWEDSEYLSRSGVA